MVMMKAPRDPIFPPSRPNFPNFDPHPLSFSEMDANHDGALTVQEAGNFGTRMHINPNAIGAEEFKKLDANHDGLLSRDEYVSRKKPTSKPTAQSVPVEPKKEGGFLGFLKKIVPFAFPAVGVGMLAKKGAENFAKNTAEEGPKGLLKQIGLSLVAPPLAAFNFIKKLF